MQLRVLAVGRLKDQSLRDVCERYCNRVRNTLNLAVVEVREAGHSERDAARTRSLEGEALLRAAPRGSRIIAVTRDGDSMDSDGFARRLASWQEDARDVTLVVGGAFGLSDGIFSAAEGTVSLSPMTLPHDLARVVLLEQVYRACTILRGEPYHKGNRS
jgi:23S rRNA (pseudouridine1915-N3)-methyltransferase